MAPLASGSPFRPRSRGPFRTSPSPPPLPPKPTLDLNSSTRSTEPITGAKAVRRSFLCDVVVEREGEETTTLLSHLGHAVEPPTTIPNPAQSSAATPSRRTYDEDDAVEDHTLHWSAEKRGEMDKHIMSLIEELVRTERSYVSRIKALKQSYADPLRHFAKQGYTVIIPMYEARTLFGNIDAVVPAAEAFLADLETMWTSGRAQSLIGDVCLKHLKMMRTMDPYRTYIGNQDEAQKTFQDMFKKVARFVTYIDSKKYETTGIGNIGLRELLMEPVQRIPRYTLLWQSIVKCMSPLSDQRAKLVEATEIASRIARCEADEPTVRATVMYCLQRNVEGIPATMFSNNRNYIDSIDAEDMPADNHFSRPTRTMSIMSGVNGSNSVSSMGSNSSNGITSPQRENGPSPLHCTLFLFDDRLMIAKRQLSSISGRKITGLDDVAGLAKSGGGVAVKEKDGAKNQKLSFRGEIDIRDVTAVDIGNGDFSLHFSKPPMDQSDRWAGRPVRSYSVIHPPQSIGLDPITSRKDKRRFVHNLWAMQALARTRVLPSQVKAIPRVLSCAEEVDLKEELLKVKTYWNVWGREGWEAEQQKADVIIHVDEDDEQPDLELSSKSSQVVIRLRPMSGGMCRFSIEKTDADQERTAIPIDDVNVTIVRALQKRGLLKLRLPTMVGGSVAGSAPSTPLHSKRSSRALDMAGSVARNLFGNGSTSTRGGYNSGSGSDAFGSTSTKGGHRSYNSRSSTMDRKSVDMRSLNSDSQPPLSPRSPRSPRTPSVKSGRTPSIKSHHARSEDSHLPAPRLGAEQVKPSEADLNARLDLARFNSQSMAVKSPPHVSPVLSPAGTKGGGSRVAALREQVEARERIEAVEGARASMRSPAKLASVSPSKSVISPKRVAVPTLASSIPSVQDGLARDSSLSELPQSPTRTKSLSRSDTMSPRGPRTPRSPVVPRSGYVPPLPPPTSTAEPAAPSPSRPTSAAGQLAAQRFAVRSPSPAISVPTRGSPSPAPSPIRAAAAIAPTARALPHPPPSASPGPSRLLGLGEAPRLRVASGGRRSASELDENMVPAGGFKRQHLADQMSPRKRSPSDTPLTRRDGDLTPTKGHEPRYPSTLGPAPAGRRTSGKTPRSRRSSGALTPSRRVSAMSTTSAISAASGTTINTLTSASDDCDVVMTDHPDLAGAADATRQKIGDARKLARIVRVEASKLRKQLGKEKKADINVSLPRSPHSRNIHRELFTGGLDDFSTAGRSEVDVATLEELARGVSATGEKLESQLVIALADSERVRMFARQTAEAAAQREASFATYESQLDRAKEREDLLRDQLHRKEIEVEAIYEAFNVELDGMYNDVNRVQTEEAFAVMATDLKRAKAQRNLLELENKKLQFQLEEERLKRGHWAKMLRAQGMLPMSPVRETMRSVAEEERA